MLALDFSQTQRMTLLSPTSPMLYPFSFLPMYGDVSVAMIPFSLMGEKHAEINSLES